MSGALSILLALAAVTGAGGAAPGRGAGGSSVLLPGRETEILGLLAPDDLGSFRCGPWRLEGIRAGPDCAIRFEAGAPGTEGPVTVRVSRDRGAMPPGLAISLEPGSAAPREAAALVACLRDRVQANAAPGFLEALCVPEARSPDARTAPGAVSLPRIRRAGGHLRLALFAGSSLLALAILGLLRRRSLGAAGEPAPAAGVSRNRRGFAGLVAATLALRAAAMVLLPPGAYEVEGFGAGPPFMDLVHQLRLLKGWISLSAPSYHPPLARALLDPWLLLGDALNVGGSLAWLRAPNLALTVAFLVLLRRLGATLGSPEAGRLAARLFAFLPPTVLLSVYQGHYFLEATLTLWFLERLAAWALQGRPSFVLLPLAGAMALWAGHFAAFTVLPGMAIFAVLAWRRGRRGEALASLLLFLSLYLPVAETAMDSAGSYAGVSVTGELSADGARRLRELHGHAVLPGSRPPTAEALLLPLGLCRSLVGLPAAVLGIVAALGVLRRRPGAALFLAGVTGFYALAQVQLYTRWENTSSLVAPWLLLLAWGAIRLPRRVRPWLAGLPWVAIFTALALAGGGWRAWKRADGNGLTELAAPLLGRDTEGGLVRRMRTQELRALPVLSLGPADRLPYHLCPEHTTARALQACQRQGDHAGDHGSVHVYALGERTVAVSACGEGPVPGDPRCPDLRPVLSSPAFRGPFLALVAKDFDAFQEAAGCPERLDEGRCELLGRSTALRLLRCTP
ncbi:MAG: hypothetical protein FJ098_00120 [Deltaproteobacteria bacterium]|nr:hypothetical protein [Deltaproteobacteria bacterium]